MGNQGVLYFYALNNIFQGFNIFRAPVKIKKISLRPRWEMAMIFMTPMSSGDKMRTEP